jgi:hypothetical protein
VLEEKGCDIDRLTVGDIGSIYFTIYNITLESSKLRKTDYVGALEKEIRVSVSMTLLFLGIRGLSH